MENVLTNTCIEVKSRKTGKVYKAQYVVERPAGQYGMVWAWVLIATEFGTFVEAYKPTATEAIDCLRQKLAKHWERA